MQTTAEYRPNPVRQAIRLGLAALLPDRLLLVSGPRRCRQVCLTFDDGPHPELTPTVLDVLDELQVKATFFLIGREAAQYPTIVRRIVADGHEIGNHTWSHHHPHTLSASEFAHELQRTRVLLSDLTGRESALIRPPHGKLTFGQMCKTWHCRQTIVLWNNDPKDFARQSVDELAEVFRTRPPQSGDIVLLHDNRPHAAGVLEAVVADAKRRNLAFVTPGDWLSIAH